MPLTEKVFAARVDLSLCLARLYQLGLRFHLRIPAFFTQTVSVNTCDTMLYLVGLGLADEKDVTVKGLELIKKAERVYLEAYTSVLLVETSKLVSPETLLTLDPRLTLSLQ